MDNHKDIEKEIPIPDLLQRDPMIATVLMASGVEYVGCPADRDKSLEQVALTFHLDPDELTMRVNEYLKNKNKEKENRG